VCRLQRKLQVPTLQNLNIIMDITHGVMMAAIWLVALVLICYILAVIDANKKKRIEDKKNYDKSPIGIFWRNLK